MSRDREAGSSAAGGPLPAAWPALPLVLLATAIVAALLAGHSHFSSWLAALALVLTAAGALLCGAFWSRHRQLDRLRDARMQSHLLGQLLDVWCWQTDAQHRLVRLQPPHGAPASAWVSGVFAADTPSGDSFAGALLWQRFDDSAHSLQARLQAQAPLGELAVLQAAGPDGTRPDPAVAAPLRPWRLRGTPRFDARGHFAGFLGVAWPTDHDEAHRTAQQGFEALLQHGPTALCLASRATDGSGWRLQRANPAACTVLGLAQAPDGQQAWQQALAGLPDGLRESVLALGESVLALGEGQALDSNGWRLRLDAVGNGLLLALAPLASGNDPQQATLAAEHAAFSYTISHDLRAPIRVVEGFGRILKEDYGNALDRVGRDHLDRVMGAAARMNHMIDALLSVSRLSTQPLAHQPVNLSQLAQWVLDDLQRAAPERTAAVHIAPGMTVQGDPTLLRMALENLLGNAWKYSAKVAQAQIRFELTEQDGRPVYCICDNGAGFDMRFADRLFGVFQRLHSSSDFQGTGVGLASVRRIVRRHGGRVWAEGEVGRGASFYFTLRG